MMPSNAEFATLRSQMEQRIVELKRTITQSKPLNAQLAAALGAQQRALAKCEECEAEYAAARERLEVARTKKTQIDAEVARLQQCVVAQSSQTHGDSIQSLTSSLTRVLDDMSTSVHVPVNFVDDTKRAMQELLSGINFVAAQARQAAAAAEPQAASARQPKRSASWHDSPPRVDAATRGRAADIASLTAAARRLRGKTPPPNVNRRVTEDVSVPALPALAPSA